MDHMSSSRSVKCVKNISNKKYEKEEIVYLK